MNDEQQILKDILDSLYGDENVLKKDTYTIKAKKEERKEKTDEIIPQINNICEKLEEELKKVLGSDTVELRKKIRLQVLTSIKAEIDNGNSVVDSSGKISAGKTFDIIRQSKSEILERVQFENDTVNYKKEDEDVLFENPQEDKELKNIFEQLEDFGVDLSQEDKDLIAEAIAKVNEILGIVKEKIESGMTEEEAWESIFEGKSAEEIETLKMYFILAEITAPFREKDAEQEKDDSGVEEKDSETKIGTESKAGKDETAENVQVKTANIKRKGFFDAYSKKDFADYKAPIGSKVHNMGNIANRVFSNERVFAILRDKDIRLSEIFQEKIEETGSNYTPLNINGAEEIMRSKKDANAMMEQMENARLKMAEVIHTTVAPETTDESATPKKGELTSGTEAIIEQAKTFTMPLHEMRHTIIDKRTSAEYTIDKEYRAIMDRKIPDEIIDPYFEAQNELLAVSLSKENMYTDIPVLGKSGGLDEFYGMRDDDTEIIENKTLSVTPPSAPTSTTTTPPPTTSIVEEMTVDDSGTTQVEQSESRKKGTLSASTMKALVESQAEARKMLEASGIIHGQTPERPTTGKTETQGAPVADNDEKNGGEPGEH